MRLLCTLILSAAFSVKAYSSKLENPKFSVENIKAIKVTDKMFSLNGLDSKTKKATQERMVAMSMNFTAADVKSDVKQLGKEWREAETPDQLDRIMSKAIKESSKKSKDFQIITGMFEVSQKLRGIIWRMRPIFEKTLGEGGKISGNSITHISAIQMLRMISTGIADYLPNEQMGTYFDYINIPHKNMEPLTHQFRYVTQFQQFLVNELIPILNRNAERLTAMFKSDPGAIYIYDNQWAFGPNPFPSSGKRYSGIGEGEINLMISSLYRTVHDFYIFSARNQNALIDIAGKLGEGVGIDSFGLKRVFSASELGLTDRERLPIISEAIKTTGFLNLNPKGEKQMKEALNALISSVSFYKHAYDYFQLIPEKEKRAMPIELNKNNARAVANMVKIVNGKDEIVEPLTGKSVTVHIQPFYTEPPRSLDALLPRGFEAGDKETTIKSNRGASLTYRNYNYGRSNNWNNKAWSTYIPSADGKRSDYMLEAKRVLTASGGVLSIFAVPAMFVR